MKLGLLLIATLAVIALPAAFAGRLATTTARPCPRICIAGQPPVCAEVSAGRYIRYSGECMKRQCECMLDTSLPQVELSKCGGALRDKCPLRAAGGRQPDQAGSAESRGAAHRLATSV